MHRNVSDRGLIEKRYAEALEREGFTLIESKVSKYSLKVQNYKEYLFDFEEAGVDINTVMQVNQKGLSSLENKF